MLDAFTKNRIEKIISDFAEQKVPNHDIMPDENFENQLILVNQDKMGLFWG